MSMDYRIYRGAFDIRGDREFLAKIREIAESAGVYIIFFDRSAIAGCNHIRTALSLAERSFFEYGTPISNFFEMEVLLYAFGTRQTGLASGFGIHRGLNDSVILICKKERRQAEEKEKEIFDAAADNTAFRLSSLEECIGKELHPVTEEDCRKASWSRTEEESLRLAKIFSITPEELKICGGNRIEELVVERCAILDVNK